MQTKNYLSQILTATIDRPLGSKHPKWGFVYEVNYGYIPDTISWDGEEFDVYVLGIDEPIGTFTGRCIAIIHRTNDDDDKLILAPDGVDFSDADIKKLTHFQEQFFESEIIC